jgi:hypothetical protein
MLQYQPQEVLALLGPVLSFSSPAIEVFEGHSPVVVGDDTVFADDTPVQIAGQIFQCRFPTSHGFAVNHPFLRQLVRQAQLLGPCPCQQARAEPSPGKTLEVLIVGSSGHGAAIADILSLTEGVEEIGRAHV